jgi:phi13 family phage major tail protein
MPNKVRFGLRNVHYALLTATTNSQTGAITYSWATPVAVPGAVSLDMSNESDMNVFYADNVAYYATATAATYNGTLEMAMIPDSMLSAIWGDVTDSESGVVYEGASTAKAFALLFQINGDQSNDYYVLYNCTATRPSVSAETIGENAEPKTQSIELTAAALNDKFGTIQAHTNDSTPTATKNGWFNSVVYADQGV